MQISSIILDPYDYHEFCLAMIETIVRPKMISKPLLCCI
jgi:hypothetical protein